MDQRSMNLSGTWWHSGRNAEKMMGKCLDKMEEWIQFWGYTTHAENKNITKGQANGLQVILEKVVLKPNVQLETAMINWNVPGQVVQVKLITDMPESSLKYFLSSQDPIHWCKSTQTKESSNKGWQPWNSQDEGNAVAGDCLWRMQWSGHKLQGSSIYNLFIHCWRNVRNWDYVMLSHVRTRNGLFLREAISKRGLDCYAVPPAVQAKNDG
jgi:hypothetical protein